MKNRNDNIEQNVVKNDKGLPHFPPVVPMPEVKPPKQQENSTTHRAKPSEQETPKK